MILLDAYALVALLRGEAAGDEVEKLVRAGDCAATLVNVSECVDDVANVLVRASVDAAGDCSAGWRYPTSSDPLREGNV